MGKIEEQNDDLVSRAPLSKVGTRAEETMEHLPTPQGSKHFFPTESKYSDIRPFQVKSVKKQRHMTQISANEELSKFIIQPEGNMFSNILASEPASPEKVSPPPSLMHLKSLPLKEKKFTIFGRGSFSPSHSHVKQTGGESPKRFMKVLNELVDIRKFKINTTSTAASNISLTVDMELRMQNLADTIKQDIINSPRLKLKMFAVQEKKILSEDNLRSASEHHKRQKEVHEILTGKRHKEKVEHLKELAVQKYMRSGVARLQQRRKKYFYEVGDGDADGRERPEVPEVLRLRQRRVAGRHAALPVAEGVGQDAVSEQREHGGSRSGSEASDQGSGRRDGRHPRRKGESNQIGCGTPSWPKYRRPGSSGADIEAKSF